MTPESLSASNQQVEPEKSAPPLWQYVPLNEYRVPATTIQSTFKTRFIAFRNRLRTEKNPASEPFHRAEDLKSLPERLLKQILPATDWHPHIQAIEDIVAAWRGTPNPSDPAVFMLNIPYSYTQDLLTCWAETKALEIIDPPDPIDIPGNVEPWMNRLAEMDDIWVLPNLEKCYLRHFAGLGMVRRLFAGLFSGRLGRGIIGCDSWAWAYLSRIFRLKSQLTLVSQGFDSEKLANWLYGTLPENKRQRFIFRQADTGRYVIRPAIPQNSDSGANIEPNAFLKDLAAYSRGIPGVALSLWRRCLKGQPDTIQAQQQENADSPQRVSIWVQSLTGMEHPSIPQGSDRSHAFILHGLLLHNGLTEDLLARILSLPAEEIEPVLCELEMAGLIGIDDGIWRVSPAGYPVVREFLRTRGFLTDDF